MLRDYVVDDIHRLHFRVPVAAAVDWLLEVHDGLLHLVRRLHVLLDGLQCARDLFHKGALSTNVLVQFVRNGFE